MTKTETPDVDCCRKLQVAVKDLKIIQYNNGSWEIPDILTDIKCCPFCGEWLDLPPVTNVRLGVL